MSFVFYFSFSFNCLFWILIDYLESVVVVMAVIKVMDEILANKIAAGEVASSCASVVKELVENSIDARSSDIRIDLKDSGTKEIKVTDNGIGMDRDDALLAFQRHATSKIINEDDLFHIETLGFRGEALASIASVSDICLKTCKDDIGTTINIKGGKVGDISNSDSRIGTSISVKNLFYNTPARLKHLKSLYTELANVTDYINKLALSRPDIRFVLTNNDSEIINTDGSDNLLKTIRDIYGINVAKKMLSVSSENRDYMVSGYVSLPEVHRSNRNAMVTFVNGRIVRNTDVNRAINDSYHSYKPDTRYPIVVLSITVDPSLIDVNIHPTKMDIKFSKIDELCNLISVMIREKISGRSLIVDAVLDTEDSPVNVNTSEQVAQPNFKKVQEVLNLNRDSEFNDNIFDNSVDFVINSDFDNSSSSISEERIVYDKENKLCELYPVGLVHGTYIICQNELGMYLIDQHAAKERINYEIYKEKLGHPVNDVISLLFPIIIELSSDEYIVLKENFDILKNIYIDISEFGVNSVIIKAHPTWLPRGSEEEAIRKIIEVVVNREKDFSIVKFNEKVATMLACKMSIKANMNITLSEMESLINDLRRCENPYNCPHGRPTIVFYSNYDLEKLFKRSGF